MRQNVSVPTSDQIVALALRALIRLEQVRGKKKMQYACLGGAASVLASAACKANTQLSHLKTQRAIVEMGQCLERLNCIAPEALRNVANGFDSLSDEGKLSRPLVATPSFSALLRAVQAERSSLRIKPTKKDAKSMRRAAGPVSTQESMRF
jgi:hypothetical protein